ncbi:hypothetical protein QBC38DRAFT_71332 [Podospora fimiseda]|uniref:Uncharacterized protein n=1 Tax=Podospora fimiseda TaxID=252190 RepID=A0AAN6YTU3_9PEZI|nr:hypothetical protein QBC38DRAFT_71332 [Podospora fimiseda]
MTKIATLAGIALLAGQALAAAPNVTVIPLGSSDCRKWPGHIYQGPGVDMTGYMQFEAVDVDDVGLNTLYTSFTSMPWAGSTREVMTLDLRRSRAIAKPYYRCINGELRYLSNDPLRVAKDVRNGFVTKETVGYKLEPYAHEIDGVRQPGVFLGALNQTTWGFFWRSASCSTTGAKNDYYEVKLQNLPVDPDTEPRAGYDPINFGFLKVINW